MATKAQLEAQLAAMEAEKSALAKALATASANAATPEVKTLNVETLVLVRMPKRPDLSKGGLVSFGWTTPAERRADKVNTPAVTGSVWAPKTASETIGDNDHALVLVAFTAKARAIMVRLMDAAKRAGITVAE